jgi:hypothetical protein
MSGRLTDKFSPENVVWQIVRFFACLEENRGGNTAGVVVVDDGCGGSGARKEYSHKNLALTQHNMQRS